MPLRPRNCRDSFGSFSGRASTDVERRDGILRLNIEGATNSKLEVVHHNATEMNAIAILLQETHRTDSEKITIPGYTIAAQVPHNKFGV